VQAQNQDGFGYSRCSSSEKGECFWMKPGGVIEQLRGNTNRCAELRKETHTQKSKKQKQRNE